MKIKLEKMVTESHQEGRRQLYDVVVELNVYQIDVSRPKKNVAAVASSRAQYQLYSANTSSTHPVHVYGPYIVCIFPRQNVFVFWDRNGIAICVFLILILNKDGLAYSYTQ